MRWEFSLPPSTTLVPLTTPEALISHCQQGPPMLPRRGPAEERDCSTASRTSTRSAPCGSSASRRACPGCRCGSRSVILRNPAPAWASPWRSDGLELAPIGLFLLAAGPARLKVEHGLKPRWRHAVQARLGVALFAPRFVLALGDVHQQATLGQRQRERPDPW